MVDLMQHYREKKITEKIEALEEKVKRLQASKKARKPAVISISQQILILEYLDILQKIESNSNDLKAVLLQYIFNSNGDENIRKRLSNLKKIKTKRNLIFLQNIFQKLKLENPLKKVKKDLNRFHDSRE
jgi:hypothetical protein